MKRQIIELITLLLPRYGYFVPTDDYMYFACRRATLVRELLRVVKGEESTLFDKLPDLPVGEHSAMECKKATDTILGLVRGKDRRRDY